VAKVSKQTLSVPGFCAYGRLTTFAAQLSKTVHFTAVHILNFKNIADQRLEFSPRLNCFVGWNGMGKTNALDALHFLCLCKSHRGMPDRSLIRHGESFFRLDARVQLDGKQEQVVAKFAAGQRKEFERNHATVERLSDHIGAYPVVMIAPDDVSLVQEGSEERRRFLDNTLSQLSREYLQQLMLYNAVLKQRNALLKRFGEERRFDATLLEAVSAQMLEPAAVLYRHRSAFIVEFIPLLQALYTEISGGHEQADLEYATQLDEQGFDMLLAENVEKDRLLQRTGVGPHKDDLELRLDGHPVKRFASQGQIKSFLLAMRLAQYEILRRDKGTPPLLLLDDIFDKLDENRVKQLIALLFARKFGQIFITDTQRNRMEAILEAFPGDHRLFEVQDGQYHAVVD
jgi:DNA replication and repair protein RecF